MARFQEWSGKTFKNLWLILLALAVAGATTKTEEVPVGTPKDLRTTACQLCVGLRWGDVPGSMGYEIQRSKTPNGPFEMLSGNLADVPIYNDFLGEVATNYYRIRSIETNSQGKTLPSD